MSLFYSAGLGGAAIPDSVVARYLFDDDGDTTVATDEIGSNGINLGGSGLSYSPTAVDGTSIANDGSDPQAQSQTSVDIVGTGISDEFTIVGYIDLDDTTSEQHLFGWHIGPNNLADLTFDRNGGDTYDCFLQIGGSNTDPDTGVSPSSGFDKLAMVVDSTDVTLFVNDTQEASASHNGDPSTMGSGNYHLFQRVDANNRNTNGRLDKLAFADKALTKSEISSL